MHRVQFVQVPNRELIQTLLRFLLDHLSKVLLCVLPLFDFCFEYFFELVYFVESSCVALLMSNALFQRLLLYFLLNRHIVVFEVSESGLQLDRSLLDRLLVWRDQVVHSLLIRLSSRTQKLPRRRRLHTLSLFFNVLANPLCRASSIICSLEDFADCDGLALFELGRLLLRRWLLRGGRGGCVTGGHLARLAAVLLGHLLNYKLLLLAFSIINERVCLLGSWL